MERKMNGPDRPTEQQRVVARPVATGTGHPPLR
jgi:hypothetical protein